MNNPRNSQRKPSRTRKAVALAVSVLFVLALAGCVSAARMLERAEAAWASGQYSQAVIMALGSYEKAVDKAKEPAEIDAAKAFLEERFPMANEYLSDQAESKLSGTEYEKSQAWKTYQVLVDMNRQVRDSIASAFLSAEDFTDELAKAKDVAAQIKYVDALERMGEGRRDSYIEAYALLGEAESLVPDYRDVRTLKEQCVELGTLTVAFSDSTLPMIVEDGDAASYSGLAADVFSVMRSYIESNDYPDFLEFISSEDAVAAREAGAVLFLDIVGEIRVSSDTDDDYGSNGTIVWERSYTGYANLTALRLSDSLQEAASSSPSLDQAVEVEFFPKKYNTNELTAAMYTDSFNNSYWTASQLSAARSVLGQTDARASMSVWAEMEYGGSAVFLSTAVVSGAEGPQELPVEADVWRDTATFINQTLPRFLEFSDINLPGRLADELTSGFLADGAMAAMLANLEG